MKVKSIFHGRWKQLNDIEQQLFRDAVIWFTANKLTQDDTRLEVHFKTVVFNKNLGHVSGLLLDRFDRRGRVLRVYVSRELKNKDLTGYQPHAVYLTTLAHELVHVKQWQERRLFRAAGELLYTPDHITYCKADSIPYSKQPWEKEALDLQEIWVKEFIFDTLSKRLEPYENDVHTT